MQKIKGVIVDPDKNSRVRLKTATVSVDDFESITACADEREAFRWFERYDIVDIVFISEKLETDRIEKFIDDVKQIDNCMTAVFVVVKPSAGSGIPASDVLMIGADGILCEPFSVENLVQVVELAERLGRERTQVRNRIAVTLLVTDLINQIDAIALLLSEGCQPQALRKSLRALGSRVKDMPEDMLSAYFDVLCRLSEKARPMTKQVATKIYRGVSARVRRNTEIRLCKEIAGLNKSREEGETEK